MMSETPILDSLIRHAGQARASLHVPGHHSGRVLPGRLAAWLGAAAKLDLTELPGLDNLALPSGCIAASAQLTANYYQADKTFYCVGGSTQGILSALLGVVRELGEVLFLNPFHQSAWQGLIIRNAWPRFAPVRFCDDTGCSASPTPEDVRQTLQTLDVARIDAVFLTSPTYEGAVADVENIAKIVHSYGLPLIVDEAHGAHLGLCEGLPPHSVSCGADVIIHSVHKMLPGLTQTAWVHVSGQLVKPERVAQAMRLMQTTSPSYLLLASLDAVQHWLRTDGPRVAADTLKRLNQFGFPGRIPGGPLRDPLKLWLPTGSLAKSQSVAAELAQAGIYVEYANPQGILMIGGMDPPEWLLARLQRLFTEHLQAASSVASETVQQRPCSLLMSPRQTYDAPRMEVPLSDACGRIAAGAVTPYPPGVPILFPGQRIDDSVIRELAVWQASGYEVHGLTTDGMVQVVAESAHHVSL